MILFLWLIGNTREPCKIWRAQKKALNHQEHSIQITLYNNLVNAYLWPFVSVCRCVSDCEQYGLHTAICHAKRLEFVSRTRYRQVLQLNRMQKQINVARARSCYVEKWDDVTIIHTHTLTTFIESTESMRARRNGRRRRKQNGWKIEETRTSTLNVLRFYEL